MGELTDDPRPDPGALCLCALLWARPEAARRVAGAVRAEDFHAPVLESRCSASGPFGTVCTRTLPPKACTARPVCGAFLS